jgi:hypothetical protein
MITRYKHRQWNVILKEHKHKKSCRLWLSTQRCLEVWDILKTTKRKIYNNDKVLKYLLYIISYYNSKPKIGTAKMTTAEKYATEYAVSCLLNERKMAPKLTNNLSWKKAYVRPELTLKKVPKSKGRKITALVSLIKVLLWY